MKNIKLIFIASILSLSCLTIIGQNSENDVISVMNKMEYSYFFKHLEYLASDELQGRDVGSEGYAKAADYVAGEFKKNELQPFGDKDTYFQKVAFSKPSIVKSSIVFKIDKKSLCFLIQS